MDVKHIPTQTNVQATADHNMVPTDPDDATALQVPAFILRKPSPRLYENLGLNEDGTQKPGLPGTRAANAPMPAEVEAEDSTNADVEVVEEAPEATAGSEEFGEEVDTETQSRNHVQLETAAVEQDIHLHDALPFSTNTRAQRSIETGTFESGGTASVETERVVNGINETPVPSSILDPPASVVIDEVAFDKSAQRIKPRRYRGLATTQIPSNITPSLWNTSNGNVLLLIGARAIHSHASCFEPDRGNQPTRGGKGEFSDHQGGILCVQQQVVPRKCRIEEAIETERSSRPVDC